MSVVNVWGGATTSSAATVVGKVTGSSVRLAVADNASLSSPVFFGPVAPTAQGIVQLRATGLDSNTRYHYALEENGVLDSAFRGQFVTHPPVGQAATFTIGMASCGGASSPFPGVGDVLASNRLSNHPVYDTIRQKALAENWLLFIQGGDLHYYDIGSGVHVPNHDLTTYRRSYDDVFRQPRQHALYRNVASAYMYDDHDFGPDESDRTAPGRDNAVRVYQERVPHYPRGAGSATAPNHQSFQIGRVLFVIWDVRADRDPSSMPAGPSKTMLGSGQRSWFESLLSTSTASFLVILNTSQWDTATYNGAWAGYTHERAALVDMLAAPGGNTARNWLPRMCMLQGDHHALGISSSNPWGGFPIFQFAPLDSGPGATQSWRDIGSLADRGLYGTLRFADNGSQITVTGTGWSGTTNAMRYSFTVPNVRPAPPTVQDIQSALYVATNNTFGTASTGGSYRDCGVVFTAPPSGRVMLYWSGAPRNTATSGGPVAYLSPEVRTGGVVGSGSVVLAPDDRRSVRNNLAGSETVRAGASHMLTGLTPGRTYNARMLHRVTSQTGEFFHRGLIVEAT